MNAAVITKAPVTIVNEIGETLLDKGADVGIRSGGTRSTYWDGKLRVIATRGEYVAQISSHYTNVLVQIVHDDSLYDEVPAFRSICFESNDVDDIMSVITDWLFN